MFQDDDLGEKIWRYSSPKIASNTTTTAVKRAEKTDGGVARQGEREIEVHKILGVIRGTN